MCLSPDEMKSSELENLIAHYRNLGGGYWNARADSLAELLKERAENGTYDLVLAVTPRHVR